MKRIGTVEDGGIGAEQNVTSVPALFSITMEKVAPVRERGGVEGCSGDTYMLKCGYYFLRHFCPTTSIGFSLFLIAFLSGCGFFPLTESLENERRETEATKEAIRKSPSLQEVNRVCESLPKTDSFRLILMRKSFRADEEYIVYGYYTENGYETVRDLFFDFFNREGWTDVYEQPGINTISVRGQKDGFSAGFTHEPVHRGVNYTLICRRLESAK